jgi:hypothetical protein
MAFLGQPRSLRGLFEFREDLCKDCGDVYVPVLPRSTLFLPEIPLPLLEVREAINAKERDGAVVFVGVMRVKVDANVPVKVANGRRRVERLFEKKNPEHKRTTRNAFVRREEALTCTPRTFFPTYVPTMVHPSASVAAYVLATLTVNSRKTPLKNSKLASCTVSMRMSSHSSTTTNCGAAPHGDSMYRSRCDDRMFAADLAAACAVCTRAEQSSDA